MDWKVLMKIVSGIVVVPVSVLAGVLWSWWEKATLAQKVVTGPLILPIILVAWVITPWWNDL